MLTNKASFADVDRHLFREGYPVAIFRPNMSDDEAVGIVESAGLPYMWLENAGGPNLMVVIGPALVEDVDEVMHEFCSELCSEHGFVIVDSEGGTTAYDALGEASLYTEETKNLTEITDFLGDMFVETGDVFVLEGVSIPVDDTTQSIVRALNEDVYQMELTEKHQLPPGRLGVIVSKIGSGQWTLDQASKETGIPRSTLARWEKQLRDRNAKKWANVRSGKYSYSDVDTATKMLRKRNERLTVRRMSSKKKT